MSDFFVGEIRTFPYGKIPSGWLACNGALMQIQQYAALYSLLGTAYGGDGKTTFALPDLRGRTSVGRGVSKQGTSYQAGKAGGTESVTLTQTQIPAHTHNVMGIAAPGKVAAIVDNYISSWGASPKVTTSQNLYAQPASAASMVPLNPGSVVADGGGGGHDNMQPFLVLNVCIAYQGIYPSRP